MCYFCTTISVFCEIYTLLMRVVAHAAILWVWCVLCRRPELGLSICPHHWCRNPGNLNVLGRSRASVGQVLVPLGRVYRPFWRRNLWGDSVAWSWVPGRVVGHWLQWSACWSRGARGRRCRIDWVCVADCRPHFLCFGDSEDLGACVMVSTGRWGLCAFCCWC